VIECTNGMTTEANRITRR